MITKEEAISAKEFFYPCTIKNKVERWRRNGKTQTWKTRPSEFRTPVKFGLYTYGQITQDSAEDYYVSEEEAQKVVDAKIAERARKKEEAQILEAIVDEINAK